MLQRASVWAEGCFGGMQWRHMLTVGVMLGYEKFCMTTAIVAAA